MLLRVTSPKRKPPSFGKPEFDLRIAKVSRATPALSMMSPARPFSAFFLTTSYSACGGPLGCCSIFFSIS